MATIAAYLMHLSQPRTASTAHVDSLSSELAETRSRLDAALTQLDALRAPVLTEVDTPVKQLTDKRAQARALLDAGMRKVDIARELDVSRQTIDKWVKEG